MNNALFYSAIIATLISISVLESCTHDQISANENVDASLYQMAMDTEGYSWYKYSDTALPKSSGSGHSNPKLRTRYNLLAASFLDSNGLVVPGTQFPDGSTIVKELMSNTEVIERYAVLFKDSNHAYADANGWVWGYIDADGTVAVKASDKGQACINCHSQADHIDYGLMNKAFPL